MLFLLLIGSTAAFNGGFVVPPAGGSIGESFETPVQVNGIFPGQLQPCFAYRDSKTVGLLTGLQVRPRCACDGAYMDKLTLMPAPFAQVWPQLLPLGQSALNVELAR